MKAMRGFRDHKNLSRLVRTSNKQHLTCRVVQQLTCSTSICMYTLFNCIIFFNTYLPPAPPSHKHAVPCQPYIYLFNYLFIQTFIKTLRQHKHVAHLQNVQHDPALAEHERAVALASQLIQQLQQELRLARRFCCLGLHL